ncbi:hypothetical protein LTR67_005545 [Exophiala xenobiotica]
MGELEDKIEPVQATVNEVNSSDESPQTDCQHAERMDGAVFSIICGAAIPCLLILTIVSATLGVIYVKHVDRYKGWPELHSSLSEPTSSGGVWSTLSNWKQHGGNAAFYINFNPSSLTALVSLTSKIIPYLSSSIMALVSFFAARRIINMSMSRDSEASDLLSPHQLTILIQLLGGSSFAPLKDCVHYHVKHKQRFISPISHAFGALVVVTGLGIIIPLVDTWFSTTVTPVKIVVLEKSVNVSSFGRQLDCTGDNCVYYDEALFGDVRLPYNLDYLPDPDVKGKNVIFLWQADESINTLKIQSDTNWIWEHPHIVDNTTYYQLYMTDRAIDSTRDFKTKTLSVQTSCVPMTSQCLPEGNNKENPGYIDTDYSFDCGSGFNGSLLSNGATSGAMFNTTTHSGGVMAGISFSPNFNLSGKVPDSEFASFQNPLNFGAWSVGWQVPPKNDTDGNSAPWDWDDEIFYDYYWNYVWMLNCTATIYETTYSTVNLTNVTFVESVKAPADVGGMLSFPFVSGLPATMLALAEASTAIAQTDNSDDLAGLWARKFSQYSLSLLAGSMNPAPNIIEQLRNNSYGATRIPMVPLFALIALKLLYCVAVLVLAAAVWHFTDPLVSQSVKERLSVKGLAAAYFADGAGSHQQAAVKNVEQLFQKPQSAAPGEGGDAEAAARGPAEEPKVAMKQTEAGGWQFVKVVSKKVWANVEPIIEKQVVFQANAGDFGADGKDAANWVSLVTK